MQRILLASLLATTVGLTFTPMLASAATNSSGGLFQWNFGGRILSCTGNYLDTGSTPKCTSLCDVLLTVNNIVNMVTSYLIAFIFPGLVLWGAFLIMTAGANPKGISAGRAYITSAVVGLAIILCSVLIVKTFVFLMGSPSRITDWPNVTCNVNEIPGGALDLNQMRPNGGNNGGTNPAP